MSNTNQIICQPSLKNDKKLKRICEPLLIGFGFDTFWYYKISDKGELSYISNNPSLSEYFYSNELYIGHPYFKTPNLLKSGFFFPEKTSTPDYSRTQGKMRETFTMDQIFMAMNIESNQAEGYGFAVTKPSHDITNMVFTNLYLLKKFISYFHVEAKDAVKQMSNYSLDLCRASSVSFYQPTQHFDELTSTEKINAFLKYIDPIQFEWINSLTKREKECVKWLLKGLTAIQIGKKIHLSNRTVESYLENIKNKLGCRTKQELFDVLLNNTDFLNHYFF